MAVPGMLWMIFFFYIPVMANVVAFKNFHISADGFLASLRESPWVGWENFKFLFSSDQAFLITKNTILYNVAFILLNLLISVVFAIIMSELRNKRLVKVYQTMSLLPYFLSWVIISYFVYAFLSPDKGIFNQWITGHGGEAVNWYNEPKYWPFILVFIGTWKGIGYNSIIYFASVMGIDPTYYEAAMVDGASKWQQIKHVTIPQLIPLMTILTILAVGNIFRADFGLFYNIPRNSSNSNGLHFNSSTSYINSLFSIKIRKSIHKDYTRCSKDFLSTNGSTISIFTNRIYSSWTDSYICI